MTEQNYKLELKNEMYSAKHRAEDAKIVAQKTTARATDLSSIGVKAALQTEAKRAWIAYDKAYHHYLASKNLFENFIESV